MEDPNVFVENSVGFKVVDSISNRQWVIRIVTK